MLLFRYCFICLLFVYERRMYIFLFHYVSLYSFHSIPFSFRYCFYFYFYIVQIQYITIYIYIYSIHIFIYTLVFWQYQNNAKKNKSWSDILIIVSTSIHYPPLPRLIIRYSFSTIETYTHTSNILKSYIYTYTMDKQQPQLLKTNTQNKNKLKQIPKNK